MTRGVYGEYVDRETKQIKSTEQLLATYKFSFELGEPHVLKNDETITNAIALINASNHPEEVKAFIIASIEQLENLLINELDNATMKIKYAALARMLQAIVIDNGSAERKKLALNAFLETFKVPSSKIEKGVKIALAVILLILVTGLSIAAYFVFPLIPFAALFTMMGLEGAVVGIASSATSFVGQIAISLIACWILHKINEVIYKPLCNIVQRLSPEYRGASSLKDNLSPLFFAPPIISEKEQPSDPLLEVALEI
jgi:hypothetical protein